MQTARQNPTPLGEKKVTELVHHLSRYFWPSANDTNYRGKAANDSNFNPIRAVEIIDRVREKAHRSGDFSLSAEILSDEVSFLKKFDRINALRLGSSEALNSVYLGTSKEREHNEWLILQNREILKRFSEMANELRAESARLEEKYLNTSVEVAAGKNMDKWVVNKAHQIYAGLEWLDALDPETIKNSLTTLKALYVQNKEKETKALIAQKIVSLKEYNDLQDQIKRIEKLESVATEKIKKLHDKIEMAEMIQNDVSTISPNFTPELAWAQEALHPQAVSKILPVTLRSDEYLDVRVSGLEFFRISELSSPRSIYGGQYALAKAEWKKVGGKAEFERTVLIRLPLTGSLDVRTPTGESIFFDPVKIAKQVFSTSSTGAGAPPKLYLISPVNGTKICKKYDRPETPKPSRSGFFGSILDRVEGLGNKARGYFKAFRR